MSTQTVMRRCLSDAVSRLAQEPLWRGVWATMADRVRNRQIEPWLLHAVMDPVKAEPEDIHALCLIRTDIFKGDIAYTRVHAGRTAFANHELTLIQRSLDHLPFPFGGTFDPRVGLAHGWDDGHFWWSQATTMNLSKNGKCVAIEVPASCVPLEVGSTDSSKSVEHLYLNGGLARWTYESDWISVFRRVVSHPIGDF